MIGQETLNRLMDLFIAGKTYEGGGGDYRHIVRVELDTGGVFVVFRQLTWRAPYHFQPDENKNYRMQMESFYRWAKPKLPRKDRTMRRKKGTL